MCTYMPAVTCAVQCSRLVELELAGGTPVDGTALLRLLPYLPRLKRLSVWGNSDPGFVDELLIMGKVLAEDAPPLVALDISACPAYDDSDRLQRILTFVEAMPQLSHVVEDQACSDPEASSRRVEGWHLLRGRSLVAEDRDSEHRELLQKIACILEARYGELAERNDDFFGHSYSDNFFELTLAKTNGA